MPIKNIQDKIWDGKTEKGRDLHIQASLPPTVVIITIYEPDDEEWIDFKIRR